MAAVTGGVAQFLVVRRHPDEHMKRKLYGVFKLMFGVFMLLSGAGLCFYKVTGRQFPDALEWLWGTISYSAFFGTIRILFHFILGAGLIWAGQQDFKHSR